MNQKQKTPDNSKELEIERAAIMKEAELINLEFIVIARHAEALSKKISPLVRKITANSYSGNRKMIVKIKNMIRLCSDVSIASKRGKLLESDMASFHYKGSVNG